MRGLLPAVPIGDERNQHAAHIEQPDRKEDHTMGSKVRHGLRRRGRRAGGKRRTPRAAIAAGALAAASIPLWPSAASGAEVSAEYKSESHAYQPDGSNTPCPVVVTSRRDGERVSASTTTNFSEEICRHLAVRIEVQYIPLGSDSVKSITAQGTGNSFVSADGVRDLTQSKHTVGFEGPFGCLCETYALSHPK